MEMVALMQKILRMAAALFLLAAIVLSSMEASAQAPMEKMRWMTRQQSLAPGASFDGQGALIRPEGYREWVYVGTPLTPNDLNDGKAAFPEFHNVYIDPASYGYYKKTGIFRDGTILVKDLVSVGAKSAASGNGYFQGEYLGLEVTVKDSKRFVKEPGNWAYFSFTTEKGQPLKTTAKAFPASSCNFCHEASAADDWVFTQYYPVLRAVRPK